jgi:hypothetical protein
MTQDKGQAWWLTPVISGIQEAAIRRIMVPGQPREKVSKTPSQSTMLTL